MQGFGDAHGRLSSNTIIQYSANQGILPLQGEPYLQLPFILLVEDTVPDSVFCKRLNQHRRDKYF